MPLEFIFTIDDFYVDQANNSVFSDWQKRFTEDKFRALYDLGFDNNIKPNTQSFTFLHFLAKKFVEFLTSVPEIELINSNFEATVPDEIRNAILNSIPFVLGAEFINEQWLENIFTKLMAVFKNEIANFDGTIAKYISEKSQNLRLPERIFFHLVENKNSREYPFAFLATYATNNQDMKIQHMPLSHALNEFKNDRQKLLSLLSCLNKVVEISPLISSFVESGEMFHPLKLRTDEAYEILKTVPAFEESGIICRVPNWWKKRSSSVNLSVKFKQKSPSMLGFNTILSMNAELSVDGLELKPEDIKAILQQTEGLALIKGKWVEVDKERLKNLLDKMKRYNKDVTFLEALKLEGGLNDSDEAGIEFTNSDFVADVLKKICNTNEIQKSKTLPQTVKATLRPYQISGYAWLCLMSELKLGACLADDMGLGKTLQVLAFLEQFRQQHKQAQILLIVPASLLDNWEKEAKRFTPKMRVHILHGRNREILENEIKRGALPFLTVTTYTTASRLDGLQRKNWDVVILDEAQAIKNSDTLQAKLIKKIPAQHRIAMTGTPVENNLSNLWSLFDFLNKGLLGSSEEFKRYSSTINRQPQNYQKLRNVVSPFILRRLKTDKSIISDLPDKIEQIDYVSLSKKQIILYRNQVKEVENLISNKDISAIQRSGIILSTITRLKQICNHPDQFLGQGVYTPSESGKFEMLKEICETIYEKREKVLVFTQFREIISSLENYLSEIFHAKGLVIHGNVPVRKRAEIVDEFNEKQQNKFMILSLRSAGLGLNLTGANHVIHFDRWWNPAVENQATDRAFRIGQKKNVIIHKFVAKGTIEERINDIIESKKSLAENVISEGEHWLTELSDSEIISMMKLEND